MPTYITMLRGINVSGKNTIKMNELKILYESLGFENVFTYIQSGNVIFNVNEEDPDKITEIIESGVNKEFSLEVSVIIRTLTELTQIVKGNPLLKSGEPDKLHVTLLSHTPGINEVNNFTISKDEGEEYRIIGKEIFLYCPYGYGRTKMTNSAFEKKLKVKATTRNWNTLNKLYEIAKESQVNTEH